MKFLVAKKISVISITLLLFINSGTSFAEMSKRQKKLHAQSLAQAGGRLYDSPAVAAYVSEIGHKALEQSPHAGRDYYFYVLDSAGVEAFTPGSGLIYISRGLLALIRSEGQLLGVLGHEIGHNVGNHLGRTKNKDRKSCLFIHI